MSHSPLILTGIEATDPERQQGFFRTLDHCAALLAEYAPELVITFGPDHFNSFFYDLMPSFCIAAGAEACIDWGIKSGRLDVDRAAALDCLRAVRADGVDVALSYAMHVDHGTTIPLYRLAGALDRYKVLPVVVNCSADPRPSFERVRKLGAAVGRFAGALGKRVAIIGSGGLSHDPPTPRITDPLADLSPFLVEGRVPTADEYRQREARVMALARALARGEEQGVPPSEDWDRRVLEALMAQRLEAFDTWKDADIDREGGYGGHEIRCWVAAFAAMRAAGEVKLREQFHAVVMEWATGMGVVTGATAHDARAVALAA